MSAAATMKTSTRTTPMWVGRLQVASQNRLFVIGAVIIVLVVVVAALGDLLAPHDPSTFLPVGRLQPPSLEHPFGTDQLGRDVLSRVLVATRTSVMVGLVSVSIAVAIGVPSGLVAGSSRQWVDSVIMRLTDVAFAFPAILLAITVLAVLGPGLRNAMIALGFVYAPTFARLTRGVVLSVRESDYIRAARAIGASSARIMLRHLLPNVLGPLIVQVSLSFAFAILAEAALSFIGIGVQPPDPAWGRMLAEARPFFEEAWWVALFPGLSIVLTVLALNFVGDGLRDVLDPRQRSALETRKARR